jgi:HK97 family phage major capsid protein
LQVDVSTSGGYLVAPEYLMKDVLKTMDEQVVVRKLARVIALSNSQSLGVPVLDQDPEDATWTSEIKTGTEDQAMRFGKRELTPHPLAKRIKVSDKLLRSSMVNVEDLVKERLSYKFAVTEEQAFMTGSGQNQPLGLFTATPSGISTQRDSSEGNSTSAITADGLINAKFKLKSPYWRSARWIFHPSAVKQIRKLKDGNGDYLWRAGIAQDAPDTILDIPYVVSEFAPSTFATKQYVGILGDFSYYWIVDVWQLAIKRLDELYAESNQVGFIGRMECDAMPVLDEAFVRIALA